MKSVQSAVPLVVLSVILVCFFCFLPNSMGMGSFEDNVSIEVFRKKSTRIGGGDWDDKTEKVSMRIALTNKSTLVAFSEPMKLDLLVFSEDQRTRKQYKIIIRETFPFTVESGGKVELQTNEVVTMWDNTGVVHGNRYSGWCLVVRDAGGKVLAQKASSSRYAKAAENVDTLMQDQVVNDKMKPGN